MCSTSADTTLNSGTPTAGNCFTSPWTSYSSLCLSIGAAWAIGGNLVNCF